MQSGPFCYDICKSKGPVLPAHPHVLLGARGVFTICLKHSLLTISMGVWGGGRGAGKEMWKEFAPRDSLHF